MGKHRKPSRHLMRKATTIVTGGLLAGPVVASPALADPPGGWDPIIECESGNRNVEHGGDPGGVSTASGYFQFVNGTWRAFGGTEFAPRAIQASKAQQTIIANRAFERNGLSDWEASRSCWQSKIGKSQSQSQSTKVTSKSAPRNTKQVTGQTTPAKIVTVKTGDTLSGLFGNNWPKVFDQNRQVIGSNPNLILPGQRLSV